MTRGGRVVLRVALVGRQATERAQAGLLLGRRVLRRLLLTILTLLARGLLLLARLLTLLAIRHIAGRELVVHAGWYRRAQIGEMWSGVEGRGTGDWQVQWPLMEILRRSRRKLRPGRGFVWWPTSLPRRQLVASRRRERRVDSDAVAVRFKEWRRASSRQKHALAGGRRGVQASRANLPTRCRSLGVDERRLCFLTQRSTNFSSRLPGGCRGRTTG